MATIFITTIKFPDKSSFIRGECNECDWIDDQLNFMTLHPRARVHLRVFHQGGKIDLPHLSIVVEP
jgi:hypothetical protein